MVFVVDLILLSVRVSRWQEIHSQEVHRMGVGDRVREARKAAGVGQVELAAAMSTGPDMTWRQSTVTAVETGRRPLRFDEAVALSRELGVTLDWLAGQAPTTEDGLRRWAREADDRLNRARAALDELVAERDPLVKPWKG
jgi:transcriptional regulator with XRE-family HTH domain